MNIFDVVAELRALLDQVQVDDDEDIGQCDDCGTDTGPRTPTARLVTIDGDPTMVTTWLCPTCRHLDEDES